jgi:hypothetical protein
LFFLSYKISCIEYFLNMRTWNILIILNTK